MEAADEVPERLPPNSAVLVGSLNHPKWLVFDCPCNSGHRIMLTLDPSHWPYWKIKNIEKLTISPSIDFRSPARRCHYFIWRGKVEWARNKWEDYRGRS